MDDTNNSIGQKQTESINSSIERSVLTNSAKAAIDTIPFIGELITSTLPDVYRLMKQSSFIDFLNGINFQSEQSGFTSDMLNKIADKLEVPENYTYLSSIIDSVFFSKSRKARILLGIITANYINFDTISYEDLILITALKDLLDEELDAFLVIYDGATGQGKEDSNGNGAFFFPYYPEKTLINTTFSKLKSMNVLGDKAMALTSKSPGSLHANITTITEKLKYYLDQLALMESNK